MAVNNPFLEEQLNRCKHGDSQSVVGMYGDLVNISYIETLDSRADYEDDKWPLNLKEVLICLAQRPKFADKFVALTNTPLYKRTTPANALRLDVLIMASGYSPISNMGMLSFLENQLVSRQPEQSLIFQALARIGTQESVNLLWKYLYNPGTSLMPEHQRESSLYVFVLELGEHRDKMPILSLLLDALFRIGLQSDVIRAIGDDVIEMGPQAEYNIHGASLNRQTPNSPMLARKIGTWMIANGKELEKVGGDSAITGFSNRLSDLLGVRQSEPTSSEPGAVKTWVREQFQRAFAAEDDEQRKSTIQTEMKQL